jgi:hypothetical protein
VPALCDINPDENFAVVSHGPRLQAGPEGPTRISCVVLRGIFLLSGCLCSTLGRKSVLRRHVAVEVIRPQSTAAHDATARRIGSTRRGRSSAEFPPSAVCGRWQQPEEDETRSHPLAGYRN